MIIRLEITNLLAVAVALLLIFFANMAGAQTYRPVSYLAIDTSSTNITTSYVQIDSATDASCAALDVVNKGASPIYLGIGASSAESAIPYVIAPAMVMPSRIHQPIPKGVRLTARAIGATVNSGFLVINCLQ